MNKLQRFVFNTKYGYMVALFVLESLLGSVLIFCIRDNIILALVAFGCFLILFSLLFINFRNIKYRIWNKRILCWWYNYTKIPEDEFDISLNLDPFAMMVMNDEEKVKYFEDIYRRRHIAHLRDLEE